MARIFDANDGIAEHLATCLEGRSSGVLGAEKDCKSCGAIIFRKRWEDCAHVSQSRYHCLACDYRFAYSGPTWVLTDHTNPDEVTVH